METNRSVLDLTVTETITQQLVNNAEQFTPQDLKKIQDAVKYAREIVGNNQKRSLNVGDRVEFTSKNGQVTQGTIRKIAIKYVTVDTDQNGSWRVPAIMLTAI